MNSNLVLSSPFSPSSSSSSSPSLPFVVSPPSSLAFHREGQSASDGSRLADEPDADEPHVRVVCLFFASKRLGLAGYDSHSGEVTTCDVACQADSSDAGLLQMLVKDLNPGCIVANQQAPLSALLDEERAARCTVVRRAASDFDVEAARHRLLLLEPVDLPAGLKQASRTADRLAYLMSALNLHAQPLSLRALGGLISTLLERRIVNELDDPETPIRVTRLCVLTASELMTVDDASMEALRIFKAEQSPSVHGIGKRKEGLSLFGLVNQTRSPGGARLLRQWFLRPSRNLDVLFERQRAVEYLSADERSHLLPDVQLAMGHVKDVPAVMRRIASYAGSLGDWNGLFQSLVHSLKIRELFRRCGNNKATDDDDGAPLPAVLQRLIDLRSAQELLALAGVVHGTVDFELARQQHGGRVIVKNGVDARLDDLRHLYDGLDDFLHALGVEQLQQYAGRLSALKCVYYPQKGFEIAVPSELVAESLAADDIDGLEYQFRTDNFHYYKNAAMRQVDAELGDVYCEIVDLEQDIVRGLSEHAVKHAADVLALHACIAELDCAVSLALAAKHMRWSKPRLLPAAAERLALRGGRHPLVELCVSQYIPNDVDFAGSRVKIVSGPNASGKSCLLKQVAVVVFLAQIGSFVPAASATVSLVDRLFTRTSSAPPPRGAALLHGSFMRELCQMTDILNNATAQSLVLIDEFGQATNELDGPALLAAAVGDLLRRAPAPPMCLVATHMCDALVGQLPRGSVGLYTMTYQLAPGDGAEPVLLYRLAEGVASSSLAFAVARRAGVPDAVVARAQALLSQSAQPLPALARLAPYDAVVDLLLAAELTDRAAVERLGAEVRRVCGRSDGNDGDEPVLPSSSRKRVTADRVEPVGEDKRQRSTFGEPAFGCIR